MKHKRFIMLFLTAVGFFIPKAFAGGLEGYTKIAEWTVHGYLDENSKKGVVEGFEGCDFRRKIIFTNNKYLVCQSYLYMYSYRPKAMIFSNGYRLKMLINNTVFDVNTF